MQVFSQVLTLLTHEPARRAHAHVSQLVATHAATGVLVLFEDIKILMFNDFISVLVMHNIRSFNM